MAAVDKKKWWVPKGEAAELCGYGVRQFGEVIQKRIKDPRQNIRGANAKLRFYLPAVIAAAREYSVELTKPVDPDDPLMGGSDSPELEKYRKVKRELGEIDLAERRKEVVKVDAVVNALRDGVHAMRETGDRLTRQFGNEAGKMFNEGVDEFEAATGRLLKSEDGQPADN